MSLREELYNTAKIAEKRKEIEKERHYKLVKKYLEDLCRKVAKEGLYELKIPRSIKLDDGKLTDEDIKIFAMLNDLDYIPRKQSQCGKAILSFTTE